MLAIYLKEDPQHRLAAHKRRERTFYTLIACFGLFSLTFSILPIIIWQITTIPKLSGNSAKAPIPQGQILSTSTIVKDVQVAQDSDGFSYFVTNFKPTVPRPKEFYLTIPKLKIQRAKVTVDSLNFYTSLSHFPGSALPGEVGNSFITGHSVLPQFNDPKNYRAIFTNLADLAVGDDVIVDFGDQILIYTVQYAKVVDPHDLSVLGSTTPTSRNLSLMTCVPPGTNSKRLVVITSLI